MKKEQMKEIMREGTQDAEDKIYDGVIGDMSFEDTIDKIIEKWADCNENTEQEVNNKRMLVMQFAELPQHYSYVYTLFSSSKKATE